MDRRLFSLRCALLVIGLVFIFGIYPLMQFWPSGWRWTPNQPEYEQMILGIYATLGVFLIRSAKNPLENLSLIWFTVWSSIVHATIMLVQALFNPSEYLHLFADIPVLYFVAIVLAGLTPRKRDTPSLR